MILTLVHKVLKKFRYMLPNGGDYLANDLRSGGAFIGKGFKVYGASSVIIDDTRP